MKSNSLVSFGYKVLTVVTMMSMTFWFGRRSLMLQRSVSPPSLGLKRKPNKDCYLLPSLFLGLLLDPEDGDGTFW
jgi:hypothetical protein